MIAVSIAMAIWTALLVWMQIRTQSRRETATGISLAGKGDDFGVVHDQNAASKGTDMNA